MNRKLLTAALAFAVLGVLGALWIQRHTGSDAFWDSESSISEQDLRSTAERLYSQPNTPNPRPPSWPPEQRVRLAIGGLGLPEPVTRETVDLLTALAYVRARRIESIHPTDTSLWVLADGGLYRVDLSTIP